jgi:hypothetical protein
MPSVQLLNPLNISRSLSYVTCGIPFAKGELLETDSLSVSGSTDDIERVQWYPQGARWSDNSVKYARCTFPTSIGASESKQVSVFKGTAGVTNRVYSVPALATASISDTKVILSLTPKIPWYNTNTSSWDFRVESPISVEIDLIGDTPEVIEGGDSPYNHYIRTKYFKRLPPIGSNRRTDWTSTHRMYIQLVVDTFSVTGLQRFWAKIGHSLWELGNYRLGNGVDYGGQYRQSCTFFNSIDLKFESKSNSAAVLVNLHDKEFQCFSETNGGTYFSYQLFKDLGINVSNYQNIYNSTNSTLNLSLSYTDVFREGQAAGYEGGMDHSRSNSIELGDEVRAISMDWPGLWPPFGPVPRNPDWIADREEAIQRINEKLTRDELKRTFSLPYQFSILGQTCRPGAGGDQSEAFGTTHGYYMLYNGWPAFTSLMKWQTRMEWGRPSHYLYEDGTPLKASNHYTSVVGSSANVILYFGELYGRSNDYGGISEYHSWGENNSNGYPALIGPKLGATSPFKNREKMTYADSRGRQAFANSFYNTSYKDSHSMFMWTYLTAFVTMDYLAIELAQSFAEMLMLQADSSNDNGTVANARGKEARIPGRIAHTLSTFYELLGDYDGNDSLFNHLLDKWGGTDTDKHYWGCSLAKEIIDDPVSYPIPEAHTTYLTSKTVDTWSYLKPEITHARPWMEGICTRGLFAIYKSALDKYGSESNFPTKALNIKNFVKYVAAAVTQYGFFIDCTDNGDSEYIEYPSIAGGVFTRIPWSEFPYTDPSLLPAQDGTYWDIQKGDVIYDVHDPTISGEVHYTFLNDRSDYQISNGNPVRVPNTPWEFNQQIWIKNKSKPFNKSETRLYENSRNGHLFTLSNQAIHGKGMMIQYGAHIGADSSRYNSYVDRTSPGLPTYTPITGDYEVEEGGWRYITTTPESNRFLDVTYAPGNGNRTVGYFQTTPPRFWQMSANLGDWCLPAASAALYFARKNEYHSTYNDTIKAKAINILQGRLDTLVEPDHSGFETKIYPHFGLIENIIDINEYYYTAQSPIAKINTLIPSPTVIGDINAGYEKLAETIYVNSSIPSVRIDIMETAAYTHFVDSPITNKISISVHSATGYDISNVEVTGYTITGQIAIVAPNVTTTSNLPAIIDWNRFLKMTFDNVSDAEDYYIIIGANQTFDDLGLEWGPQDYNGTSIYMGEEDLENLYNIDIDDPNYIGPKNGNYTPDLHRIEEDNTVDPLPIEYYTSDATE